MHYDIIIIIVIIIIPFIKGMFNGGRRGRAVKSAVS